MSKPGRTNLQAVYLTSIERDLVMNALDVLCGTLTNSTHETVGKATQFAKSYTAKRLAEVRLLFADKTVGGKKP